MTEENLREIIEHHLHSLGCDEYSSDELDFVVEGSTNTLMASVKELLSSKDHQHQQELEEKEREFHRELEVLDGLMKRLEIPESEEGARCTAILHVALHALLREYAHSKKDEE